MTAPLSRRTALALATGSLLLGALAAPALAAPSALGTSAVSTSSVGTDSEHVCVYTRNDPRTGERDGFCVWFPDVLPPTPGAASAN